MTAEIITLADRRPTAAPLRRETPAAPATIVLLPPSASRAAALSVTEQAGNAAASAAALNAACHDLLDKLATIGRHSDAIRTRMDALQKSANTVAATSDSIIDALRGVVAVKHGFARESRNA